MKVAEVSEKVRGLLRELVEVGPSQAELAKWLRVDQSQISRLLSGTATLELERVLGLLDALGVPRGLFFDKLFEEEKVDPATVLHVFREHAGLPPDPFLVEIEAPCLELNMLDVPGKARPSRRRADLLWLEDLRFDDADTAKSHLEQRAREWIAEANGSVSPPAGELLGDIAIALAIWASIQRIRGRRDDASMALEPSCNLADKSGEHWVSGFALQKSGYLLMDRGEARRGIRFLKEAYYLFGCAGEDAWQAKIWVDLGILHNFLGEHSIAIEHLEMALARLPQTSRRSRFAAHYDLALALHAEGNMEVAAEHLQLANALRPDDTLATAYLRWREGSQLLQANKPQEAAASLEVALSRFDRCDQLGEALLVLVDLAEAHFRQRSPARLGQLSERIVKSLRPFQKNKVITASLQAFALACQRGKVSLKLLDDMREQLEAEFPQRSTHLDQA